MTTGRDKVRVYALERGTVIDHLRRGEAGRVLRVLALSRDTTVAMGLNFESTKLNRKDIIKLEDFFLDEETASRIALISPEATVARIEGGAVVDKYRVVVPQRVDGLMECANPKCITRREPMMTRFENVTRSGKLLFRCLYCERNLTESDVREHLL